MGLVSTKPADSPASVVALSNILDANKLIIGIQRTRCNYLELSNRLT